MRYEIVLDDEDAGQTNYPWNAALYLLDPSGETGEVLSVGVGTTPLAAVRDLTRDWPGEVG